MEKIRFVCATRLTREAFFSNSALGRSLNAFRALPDIELELFASNRAGLPVVYNTAIERAKKRPAILVFAHDDIHLPDMQWASQMTTALAQFQIVGPVGNKRRVPGQPSWVLLDKRYTWDSLDVARCPQ